MLPERCLMPLLEDCGWVTEERESSSRALSALIVGERRDPFLTLCTIAQLSTYSANKPLFLSRGKTFPSASGYSDLLFPCPLQCPEEVSSGTTTDEVPFTDGSGKHLTEPNHRRCGIGVSGETTKLSYPLPGCWQSVYRAELHAIMVACERMEGSGRIVTDCKGAAVVANKLKHGLRHPR
eukprot:4852131-Amphidinium_carterae.1